MAEKKKKKKPYTKAELKELKRAVEFNPLKVKKAVRDSAFKAAKPLAMKKAKEAAKTGIGRAKDILNAAGQKAAKNRPQNVGQKVDKLTSLRGPKLDSALAEAEPEIRKRTEQANFLFLLIFCRKPGIY